MDNNKQPLVEVEAWRLFALARACSTVGKTFGTTYPILKTALNTDWIVKDLAEQLNDEEIATIRVTCKLYESNIISERKNNVVNIFD